MRRKDEKERGDLLQGTLDMLVLNALQPEPMHGWGITERIEEWSERILQLGQGTLYPALYRLERQGLIRSEWQVTANNRRARYYSLTRQGRRQLDEELAQWRRTSRAVNVVIEASGRNHIDALERGLDEEIRFHIDQQVEKNLRAGMTTDQARRRALLRFGNVEHVRENTRDEFRVALLQDSLRDLRQGARALRRAPAFTVVAILTLALGIGATTAVFTVVQGVLIKRSRCHETRHRGVDSRTAAPLCPTQTPRPW